MKKYVAITLLPLFILTSCGTEVVNENGTQTSTEVSKQDFNINIKTLSDFNNDVSIIKSGNITSSSNLTISSQASGKVNSIKVSEGDKVYAGQVLATLSDNISNYGLTVDKTKNALNSAEINYDSTLISLDKAIQDSKIALDKAKANHEILLKDSEIQKSKAEYDLNSNSLTDEDSQSNLNYKTQLASLQKAKSDYELTLKNNQITLNNYKSSIKSLYDTLSLTYFDLINNADELFSISEKNKLTNDGFKQYLGAKQTSTKTTAEDVVTDLLKDYEAFISLDYENISEENMIEKLEEIETRFDKLQNLVDVTRIVLKNTIPSTNLTQTGIDTLVSTYGGFGSTIQSINSSYISLYNTINTFLSTYKDNEKSQLDAINIQEKQLEVTLKGLELSQETYKTTYDRTLLSIEDSIKNSEINITNLENTYNNAVKNKEVTLRSLENAIEAAKISYNEALNNYSKLTITSPISGTISDVLIDLGQEISNGTTTFNLVSSDSTEVELYLTSSEISNIKKGDKVEIVNNSNSLAGVVESISTVATSDFTYKTVVKILDKVNLIGDFVDVKFSLDIQNTLLPINIVNIVSEGNATINILVEGNIQKLPISIGKTYGDNLEVISELDPQLEIITNDISNFDQTKFNLKVNK